MINKISVVGNMQAHAPAFKAEAQNSIVSNPINNTPTKGLDALASYNKAYTENLTLKATPLLLNPNVDPKEAIGEKIYTSDGKLHSIVRSTDKAKIVYQFNLDETNSLDSISITDAKTGKILKEQIGYESVLEFNPITSKLVKETHYDNGELCCITKIGYKNGKEQDIYFDAKEDTYTVSERNPRTNEWTTARFDKNKQIQNVIIEKGAHNKTEIIDIDFYNGSIISATKSTTSIMPNTMGREAMNLENMQPHEKVSLDFNGMKNVDARALVGEKTYYSNGFVETNTIDLSKFGGEGSAVCHFTPDGKLIKIVRDNKTIDLSNNRCEIIEETLPDGSIKKTSRYEDACYVDITSDDSHRFVSYDKKGNIQIYRDNEKSLHFNKQGMLEDAFTEEN